ncbi:MAG: hypothetical protein ACLRZ7_11630 [Lachnospiraceae bacterium]
MQLEVATYQLLHKNIPLWIVRLRFPELIEFADIKKHIKKMKEFNSGGKNE